MILIAEIESENLKIIFSALEYGLKIEFISLYPEWDKGAKPIKKDEQQYYDIVIKSRFRGGYGSYSESFDFYAWDSRTAKYSFLASISGNPGSDSGRPIERRREFLQRYPEEGDK